MVLMLITLEVVLMITIPEDKQLLKLDQDQAILPNQAKDFCQWAYDHWWSKTSQMMVPNTKYLKPHQDDLRVLCDKVKLVPRLEASKWKR